MKPIFETDLTPKKVIVESVTTKMKDTVDWGIQALGVPSWWIQTKGEGIKVAILDTGCDLKHVDLKANIVKTIDFTGSKYGAQDIYGHGTHCAGIICATDNNTGIVGVAPRCKLYVAKVLNDRGSGTYLNVSKGLQWALSQNVDIVSISLGGTYPDGFLRIWMKKFTSAGKILICAAGNSGNYRNDTIDYPAKYPEAISVGSINNRMTRSYFSSIGKRLDIMAPGERVYSTYPKNRYAILSGTSMATPFIAGIAALVLAKHRLYPKSKTPVRNNEEMRQHLAKTASKVSDVLRYGKGIVNPRNLINEL